MTTPTYFDTSDAVSRLTDSLNPYDRFKNTETVQSIKKYDPNLHFFQKTVDRQNCLQFGDEAYSIILNTACSPEKVPQLLKAIFEYINDTTKGSGEAAGMVKGELEAARNLARAMKADGEPVERISKYTGIYSEEIEKR